MFLVTKTNIFLFYTFLLSLISTNYGFECGWTAPNNHHYDFTSLKKQTGQSEYRAQGFYNLYCYNIHLLSVCVCVCVVLSTSNMFLLCSSSDATSVFVANVCEVSHSNEKCTNDAGILCQYDLKSGQSKHVSF